MIVMPEKMLVCKYGCGYTVPYDNRKGLGKVSAHYQLYCPSNPESQINRVKEEEKMVVKQDVNETPTEEKAVKEDDKEKHWSGHISNESIPNLSEVLERIIREVSQNKKIPGVLRHVKNYLDNPRRSFDELANIMAMADFPPMDRKVILKNWATYLKLDDADKLIEREGKDEDQKKEEKKKEDEVDTGDAIDKELERSTKAVMRDLQLLRLRKERKMLEQELQEPKPEPKKEEEEKLIHIVNGVTLKVTPQEKLAWMKYESEEKEKQEERERRREEQKMKDDERYKRKDDDTVEWPIGDKVIKVRPETIPMLVMQQSQKKEENPELKMVMEEMKQTREQFHQFQIQTFQKEIDELKAYSAQDPLDRLYMQKEKLEKLGLVSSTKASAQERLYDMDSKKLDTLLKIVVDKSSSTQNKVDSLLGTIGPAAQDYIKEMILQMKQQRGALAPEVPRTEQQASDTLAKLEEIDKAMESADKTPKFVSVEKSGAKPEAKEGS